MNFSVLRRAVVSAAAVWALASGFVTDGNDYWADWAQVPTMIKLVSLLGLGFVSNQLKVMIPNVFDTKVSTAKAPATVGKTVNKMAIFFEKLGTITKGVLWTGIPAAVAYYFTRGQADNYLLAGPAGGVGLLAYLSMLKGSKPTSSSSYPSPAYVRLAEIVEVMRGRDGAEPQARDTTIQLHYVTANGNRRALEIRPSDNQYKV